MQAILGQKAFISLAGLETENQWSKQMRSRGLSGSDRDFWQLWAQYQDYFYSRSLQWMSGNPTDAEDVLSQAMLKAWNEWPKYAGKITNPKAWLSQITHNLCIDIHRKRQRERMENIEDIQSVAHTALSCSLESAESEIFRHELRAYLNHKIESLPPRLRDPFILRYCQDKSYRDIAKELSLSEDNIRKRVKQAQTILQKQLNKYLAGEDDTSLDSLSQSLKSIIPIVESQPDEKLHPQVDRVFGHGKESPMPQVAGRLSLSTQGMEFPVAFDETALSDWEAAITTKDIIEEINYKVSVIWLETLPHIWYSPPSPLGWT